MVKKIKQYMKRMKVNQSDMARLLGTSRFTLSRWINGHNRPSKAYEKLIETVTSK